MLYEVKPKIKFMFVDEFPSDEEVDYAARLREEPEEPKATKTKFFGDVVLRQIAKVDWREVEIVVEREKYDRDGRLYYEEEKVTMYEMVKGEVGGWLESRGNLSQYGECWVHADGFVMGAAFVYGDAQVKGGAEVGDAARVGDKVVLDGEFGVGGAAKILDEAKVEGKKRMAVFGSALVRGKSRIVGEAKVYGHARVGDKKNAAYVSGESRAYGNSIVKGTVKEKCEVFGRARIAGSVSGKCWIGGTTYVGKSADVSGNLLITRGHLNGKLDGTGLINWDRFVQHEASTVTIKDMDADEEAKDPKAGYEEADDSDEDREIKYVESEVKSVEISSLCSVSECTFRGRVRILGGSVVRCKVEDSLLGMGSYWGSSYSSMSKVYAYDSEFKGCFLPHGEFTACKFENVWIPPTWTATVTDSELSDCALLAYCRNVYRCKLEGLTVMGHYITEKNGETLAEYVMKDSDNGEDVKNVAIIETNGSDKYWWKYHPDNPYRELVVPDEFKELLGAGRWGEEDHGAEEMDGIAALVYKYDEYHKYLLDRSDTVELETFTEEYEALRKARYEISTKRSEWFKEQTDKLEERLSVAQSEMDKAKERAEKAEEEALKTDEDGKVDKRAVERAEKAKEEYETSVAKRDGLRALLDYVLIFKYLDWTTMSEESCKNVQGEILKTINSFDEETFDFVRHSDFGIIEADPAYRALEDKYQFSLNVGGYNRVL